jgi:hypothetical protein
MDDYNYRQLKNIEEVLLSFKSSSVAFDSMTSSISFLCDAFDHPVVENDFELSNEKIAVLRRGHLERAEYLYFEEDAKKILSDIDYNDWKSVFRHELHEMQCLPYLVPNDISQDKLKELMNSCVDNLLVIVRNLLLEG